MYCNEKPAQGNGSLSRFSRGGPDGNRTRVRKAIRESIYKVVNHGITQKTKELGAADIQGLQKLIEARKRLQELGRLHISL